MAPFARFFGAPLTAQVVKVEGGSDKEVLQMVTVDVNSCQGVSKARGERLTSQHLKISTAQGLTISFCYLFSSFLVCYNIYSSDSFLLT